MAFNREPGCERELNFMIDTMASVARTGNFVGTMVPIIVTDPHYGDGQWIKVQNYSIQSSWEASNPNLKREWRLNIHYMYNVSTSQTFQMKMKNSYEFGCAGTLKTVS